MSNIAKITNISIDNIDKVYEVNKSGVTKIMGVDTNTTNPLSYSTYVYNDKIDSDLTNFPLLVNLSNSAGVNNYDLTKIFDTIGSDYTKLRIYDSNGQQLYTEVENWDAANKTAQLWTKMPTFSSSMSNFITLDYSATSGSNDYISDDPTAKAINLNIDLGSEGTYDTQHASNPCVIKESATSYKMWYSGDNSRIIYCTSTDGINWTNFQMVVDKGSEGYYDTSSAYRPSVIKESDTSYKMWYTGGAGGHNRILYCTSIDGINWTNFQLVIDIGSQGSYDAHHAYYPSVIKDGSTYKMWYAGDDVTYNRVLYATSTDGINWSNFQLVVDKGSEGTNDVHAAYDPSVIKDGSTYKMWYNGSDGTYIRILYCTSNDGINWSNFQMVIDKGSEGTYDTTYVQSPNVIKESSNLYKMWYGGYSISYNSHRILYTTSEDGVNWYKNVVNRVWDDDYAAVYHLNQSPISGAHGIYDSTKNANHGTTAGMTGDDTADGKIGKALNFDGGNNYISLPNISIDSAMTYTAWVKTNNNTATRQYILTLQSNPPSKASYTYMDRQGFMLSDNDVEAQYLNGDSDAELLQVSNIVSNNTWYFISLVVDSNGGKLYVNGELKDSSTTVPVLPTPNQCIIGARNDAQETNPFHGTIDEVRIAKTTKSVDWFKASHYSDLDKLNYWGSSKMVGPPIPDSYTKLLMSMEGNSSDEIHDITLKGNASFNSDEKKFGNSSLYTNSSSDFISIPDSDDWYLGTEDFTIECWIRPSYTTTIPIYSQIQDGSSDNNRIIFGYWSGKWNFYVRDSKVILYISVSNTVTANEWAHIAITRSGDDFRIFKNGIQLGTTTTDSGAIPNNIGLAYIGATRLSSTWPVTFRGNMDEFRFSKGIARWTSNFTPPTSPYTTDLYTKLLLHFEGDRSLLGHTIVPYTEMEVRNSEKKLGKGSMYFNGSSYLKLDNSDDWALGSGDFTVDFWYNFIEDKFSHFVGQYTMGYNVDNSWSIAYNSNVHKFTFSHSITGSDYHSTYSDEWIPTLSTWYHIACVRNNNTLTFYVDGQAKGSATFNDTIATSTKSFFIGRNNYNFITGGYWMLKGYMDELRVSKGIARWTSNFTPPNSEY